MSQTQHPEGLQQWTVWNPEAEKAYHFDERGDAEERQDNGREEFGIDAELYPPGELPESLSEAHAPSGDAPRIEDEAEDVEVIEHGDTPAGDVLGVPQDAPDFAGDLDISQDPLNVLPGWMTTQVSYNDKGDSSTTVNKRGCQVIAEYLNLETEHIDDEIVKAHENDFEYAHYVIEVTKPDGRSFRGHGTARADDADQGEGAGWKLNMMAETRAYKRAVKAATGGGIEAFAKEQGGQS